ncbi:unnamed protein product [Cochlearia groenlandica]
MSIKAGKVLRTATAAARKFQSKQFSAAPSPSPITPPSFHASPVVSPASGVGTFLGIPMIPRCDTDLLISKYIRLSQNRLTKKGDFTEEKLKKLLCGDIGINETVKVLEGRKTGGDFSANSNNIRSIAKSRKKKK